MEKELIIKKCMKCGATVRVLEDCTCDNCGIKCCGEEMKVMKTNSVDAAVEKHKPTYEKEGNEIIAKVNHVMEDEHYIEWIALVAGNKEYVVNLKPGEIAEARFPYVENSKLYAYCNKHGLWETEVK